MNDMNLGQYEIMDRLSCLINQIEDNIHQHSQITKKQRKKVSKAIRLLSDVYQLAGQETYKNE